MADEQDRINQIRARRSRGGVADDTQSRMMSTSPGVTSVGGVGQPAESAGGLASGMVGAGGTPFPWLQDRVTLSLEAQIAMIELRANYRLTLADLGYHNRLQILEINPGTYVKVEPTGCYKMVYHNRV